VGEQGGLLGWRHPLGAPNLPAPFSAPTQIGALSRREALTPLGAVLSLLPVDVAVGKLLVLGAVFGMPGESACLSPWRVESPLPSGLPGCTFPLPRSHGHEEAEAI
jgi:hypothetical protein